MSLVNRAMYTSDGGVSVKNGSRSTTTEYKFDTSKGIWVEQASSVPTTVDTAKSDSKASAPNTSKSQTDTKTEAEKEYIETEFNTLTGDASLTASKKSIRIKVNNTVEIKGIGKYLSGKYFVSSVKRSLNKDSGYSQSITVLKNGFGDSLKSPSDTSASTDREKAVSVSTTKFNIGDRVKIVGNATYSNASEGVPVPAWVKTQTLTIKQVSSDESRVLLMPINSWTYVRFIQKV